MSVTPAVTLFAVRGNAAGTVWASSTEGKVLRWTGSSGWVVEDTGTNNGLYGLAHLGDAGLLVVGEDGAILRQRP